MTVFLQKKVALVTVAVAAFQVMGCASSPPLARAPASPAPTVEVVPAAETAAVASANVDAADDAAVWAAPAGTSANVNGHRVTGFVAGTDKKAGLYIFGFDGRQLQFMAEGLLNNVDLREGILVDGRPQVVLGASDRARMGISLYLFDPASGDPANAVKPWGFIKSDVVEPYGFCFGRIGDQLYAFLIGKDGQLRQYRIDPASGGGGSEIRRFAIGSQAEGCVVDDRSSSLFVGEELKGVWRYGAAPDAGAARSLIQGIDASGRLIADVEGVTLIRDGVATYLIVSSQGDSAFAVWRVDGDAASYSGRFRVAAANGIDAVTGTDGIEAHSGPTGPFPDGLVVVQDDQNDALPQNFKLIDWREIRRALGLSHP